jgi:hypothetical protein
MKVSTMSGVGVFCVQHSERHELKLGTSNEPEMKAKAESATLA